MDYSQCHRINWLHREYDSVKIKIMFWSLLLNLIDYSFAVFFHQLIEFTDRGNKNHRLNVFEVMNPFATFSSLSTNINHPEIFQRQQNPDSKLFC